MAIASHPISFKLLNPDGESVIGIFDGKGQTSKLEIKNPSRQDWHAARQLQPRFFHFSNTWKVVNG